MVKIIIYALLSATGLVLLKLGTGNKLDLQVCKEGITISVNYMLIVGMVFYILSFIVSLIIMRTTDLSYFYPLSIGMAYIIVCIMSYWVLGENISKQKLIGMLVILVGVIIMNLQRE